MKNLVMLEIIAPSECAEKSIELPQEVRNEIKERFFNKCSWEEVFAPIKDEDLRQKYIELFNEIDKIEE
jgi:hypothetical protein